MALRLVLLLCGGLGMLGPLGVAMSAVHLKGPLDTRLPLHLHKYRDLPPECIVWIMSPRSDPALNATCHKTLMIFEKHGAEFNISMSIEKLIFFIISEERLFEKMTDMKTVRENVKFELNGSDEDCVAAVVQLATCGTLEPNQCAELQTVRYVQHGEGGDCWTVRIGGGRRHHFATLKVYEDSGRRELILTDDSSEVSVLPWTTLEEGDSVTLQAPVRPTVPKDVFLYLAKAPSRGRLFKEGSQEVTSGVLFGALIAGSVCYENTEPGWSDLLQLEGVWRGKNVSFIYPIYILSRNRISHRRDRSVGKPPIPTAWTFLSPRPSQPDTQDVTEGEILEVNECGLMELSNLSLKVSSGGEILFNLIEAPKHGNILLRGEPASRFTLADVESQLVLYEHDGAETGSKILQDWFMLKSGEEIIRIDVNINPVDDSAPRVKFNENLEVLEGGEALVSRKHLDVEDADTESEDITCQVVTQPLLGHLQLGQTPIMSFNYSQLLSGNVTYVQSVHKGFEPRDDKLSIACFDPENNTESSTNFGLMSINIEDRNDEPPHMSPRVITVVAGHEIALSEAIINPKDMDTPLEELLFRLHSSPSKGVLVRKINNEDEEVSSNFTMNDLIRIYYKSRMGIGRDEFVLSISDGLFESKGKVKIVIKKEESSPLILVNEGLELEEGSSVMISESHLLAKDTDTSADKLEYILRDPPIFGCLLINDSELDPGANFSQADISMGSIIYRHDDPSSTMDVFVFDLTDGLNILYNQNFFITIISKNNSYPLVSSKTPTISPLSVVVLTSDLIRVDKVEEAEFHVMSAPRQGRLERRDGAGIVTMFTWKDIQENRIQYVHLSNFSAPEIIQFEVTDGKHPVFHSFSINFTSEPLSKDATNMGLVAENLTMDIASSRPSVVANSPIHWLEVLDSGEVGAVISRGNLEAEEEESDPDDIQYEVVDSPKYGRLVNRTTNATCGNFTQADINSELIYYYLNKDSKAPSDAFIVDIVGKGKSLKNLSTISHFKTILDSSGAGERISDGVPLKGVQIILEWSWVQFETNFTQIQENISNYKIPATRWGSLTESAFVGIQVTPGNATIEEDFTIMEDQIQFSPGQSIAYINIFLKDDYIFEKVEYFIVSMVSEQFVLKDEINSITVLIEDYEDEPSYTFKSRKYEVYENTSQLFIPVKRNGDLSQEVELHCVTEDGSASGGPTRDFMPPSNVFSKVKFSRGEELSYCRVLIVDDTIMEPEENFIVRLDSTKHKEGVIHQTRITIRTDQADLPVVAFANISEVVYEDEGWMEVNITVEGDLENVTATVAILGGTITARANEDFIVKNNLITILPGIKEYAARIEIIEDNMKFEGNETFSLSLSDPVNCKINKTNDAMLVTIVDDMDGAIVQFSKTHYVTKETNGNLNIELERQGDIMKETTVICYAEEDSSEKSNLEFENFSNFTLVTFLPGEVKKNCSINIIDDNIYENSKNYTFLLKTVGNLATIGSKSKATVLVTDPEDKENILFEKSHYFIKEPVSSDAKEVLIVNIIREGDSAFPTQLRVFSKDGTAQAGLDYIGKSAAMQFDVGQKHLTCEFHILSDKEMEIKEYFTINLEVLNKKEILYTRKSVVYIYDSPQPGGLIFPAAPLVLSLLHHDKPADSSNQLIQGYPALCISVCNEKHTMYDKFKYWCIKNKINDTSTLYHWQIEDDKGNLEDISSPLFYDNTKGLVLESVYLYGGARLRCGICPVSTWGDTPGKQSYSPVVTVSRAAGLCPQPSHNMMGVEPFTAHLSYTDGEGSEVGKLFKLSVKLAHYDGMFPAVSTQPLGDPSHILKANKLRSETHKCSNIVTDKESLTKDNFITSISKGNPSLLDSTRGYDARQLHKQLDLDSCIWIYEAHYTLSEITNYCGAKLSHDSAKTALILQLPLFVTYFKFSLFGWQHIDSAIVLRLKFSYDSSLMSQEAVMWNEMEQLEGALHPISMHISQNGSLVVFFRTTPKFNGHFLIRGGREESGVSYVGHPEVRINLRLTNNITNDGIVDQFWTFSSEFNNEDYTGRYEIRLVPCLVETTNLCIPRDAIIFPLDIHFQQISDPILKNYTLNTSFHLIKKRHALELLEESSMFEPDDHVIGFITMDPPQDEFSVNIDQCYICAGRNGKTPKYNPKHKQYGCLVESSELQFTFKIIDKHEPNTVQKTFQNRYFNATLYRSGSNISIGTKVDFNSSMDLFRFEVSPLFEQQISKVWFVQCTFTIKSAPKERLRKRSVIFNKKRGESVKKGSNMHQLHLQNTNAKIHNTNVKTKNATIKNIFKASRKNSTPIKDYSLSSEQLNLIWLFGSLSILLLCLTISLLLITYVVYIKKEISEKTKHIRSYRNVHYTPCSEINIS